MFQLDINCPTCGSDERWGGDSVARFIADQCLRASLSTRVATADLCAAYDEWCAQQGEQPVARQLLGRRVDALDGVERYRSNGRRYYNGIALRSLSKPAL